MTAELNMRRKQLQQLNLMRKKNQQREYKAILIENLQRKDMRQTMMVQRKQAQQENCLRMNQAIQDQIFRTAATTSSIILPQPFEKYKKEFDAIKEPKK